MSRQLLDGAPYDGAILLGHLHWDHTHGIPFFRGGCTAGARVDLRLPEQGESAEAVLQRAFSPPHFPIVPSQLGPGWSFSGLAEGAHEIEGFDVLAREIPHKGGRAFGYRVERDGATIAYLSDHSPTAAGPGPDGLGERHEAALELATGADVLIHDAQHLASQFPGVDYLGHASVEYAVALGSRGRRTHPRALPPRPVAHRRRGRRDRRRRRGDRRARPRGARGLRGTRPRPERCPVSRCARCGSASAGVLEGR